MLNKLLNVIVSNLSGKIPYECLGTVRDEVTLALSQYDIVPKTQEISRVVIPNCLSIYLAVKKIEGKSDNTLKLYELYITEFVSIVQKPLESITTNDIRMYLYLVQQNRHISNRTLDSRRTVICTFLTWCAAEEYIPKNPAISIKPIKYERKECVPLTDIQLENIRKSCITIRELALVEVLYSSGCRVTELERLTISDVNFESREVKLFGKGNKHRTSYLSAKAILALQTYLASRTDDCPSLFITERKPFRGLTKSGIECIIRKLGNRCGIQNLHPHLFRHTVATDCLNRGMDVTQLQRMLGHSNVNTTMIYAKICDESVKNNHHKCVV